MKTTLAILAVILIATFATAGATSRRERIQVVYQGTPANYQLYIFGGQALRCRGSNLHIYRNEQGDGDGPIVIECR